MTKLDSSTGLYQLDVTKSRKGGKLTKDRVTLNFIVNASGSECMIQMIGKSKKLRALKNINTSSHFGIKYYNNSKSWMRTDIFQQVMNDFCRYTKYTLKRHHVVLLMDNFSGHKLPDYWKKVVFAGGLTGAKHKGHTVIFLPQNITSVIQLLDQGIIIAFKAQYRRQHIR